MFLPSVSCGDKIGSKLVSGTAMERDRLRSAAIVTTSGLNANFVIGAHQYSHCPLIVVNRMKEQDALMNLENFYSE